MKENILNKCMKIFITVIVCSFFTSYVYAHPGRLDSNGGHYNRKTGEYHYHDGLGTSSSESLIEENDKYNNTNSTLKKENINNSVTNNTTKKTNTKNENNWLRNIIGIFIGCWWIIIPLVLGSIENIKEKITKRKNKEDNKKIESSIKQLNKNLKVSNIENERRIENDKYICPLCQGEVIIKKGKYGLFWGCSNYPRCKYTKSLTKNRRE